MATKTFRDQWNNFCTHFYQPPATFISTRKRSMPDALQSGRRVYDQGPRSMGLLLYTKLNRTPRPKRKRKEFLIVIMVGGNGDFVISEFATICAHQNTKQSWAPPKERLSSFNEKKSFWKQITCVFLVAFFDTKERFSILDWKKWTNDQIGYGYNEN